MTFNETVQRQVCLRTWIYKNLKPIKRFNRTYGSSKILLGIVRSSVGGLVDVEHEEFKQAMAASGYFADCSHVDENYSTVIYNVSEKSVRKLL